MMSFAGAVKEQLSGAARTARTIEKASNLCGALRDSCVPLEKALRRFAVA